MQRVSSYAQANTAHPHANTIPPSVDTYFNQPWVGSYAIQANTAHTPANALPCRPVVIPLLNLPLCKPKAMLTLPALPSHFTRIRPPINLNHICQSMSTQNCSTHQSPHSITHSIQPTSLPKLAIRHIPHHAHKSPNQGGELFLHEKCWKKNKSLNLK